MSGKQIFCPNLLSRHWKWGSLCSIIALTFLIFSGLHQSEAAPRKKAGKKKPAVKKEEPLPPRFMVKSKPVDPTKQVFQPNQICRGNRQPG